MYVFDWCCVLLDVFTEYGKKKLEKTYAYNKKAELTGEVTMKVPHAYIYTFYIGTVTD